MHEQSLQPAPGRMVISSTWDGLSLGEQERSSVTVWEVSGGLEVHLVARFWGDPAPSAPKGSTDGLWEHEVVEFFLAERTTAPRVRYLELEVSPHGHFLLLEMASVRRRLRVIPRLEVTVETTGERWSARVFLAAEHLPPKPWRANAFAIHGEGPRRRYLAAHPLPGKQPDFHRVDAFPPFEAAFQARSEQAIGETV